ncbi:MAG: HlyC/CorC family transporter [Lachnospiraceae bacterium]|nr:HlyC/CorC family transporter [Lachnospiraceae bacterium]
MDGHPIRGFIVIFILVILNALITTAETAFGLVNESNVRKKAEEGDKKAELLVRFIDRPNSYINVIELLVTVINIIIGIDYAFTVYPALQKCAEQAGGAFWNLLPANVWVIIATILASFLVVLFNTLLPRRLAYKNPEGAAFRYVWVIHILTVLLSPVLWIFMKATNLLLRLCRINPADLEENVTQDEIISMVNEGHEQGVLEAEEAEMISNIIEFDEKVVKDIMTHRRKMVALSADMTVEEAIHFMLNESYSRFPLYGKNVDDIVGILYLKDVTECYINEEMRDKPLREIAREPFFVPDTQNIDALFQDMQTRKIHMAIVIDEYGQTAGLVAMEDILEEIVGDILDEYDKEEKNIIDEGDGSLLTVGAVSLEELGEQLGVDFEEEEYDTLNGLLISLLDHIPEDGEKAVLTYQGYRYEILSTQNRMIESVRVTPLPKEETAEEKEETGDEE